jgi:YidC/Oxa1 family membrane protein insertase
VDRQTTIGFILIALILFVWMWMSAPQAPRVPHVSRDTALVQQKRHIDSLRAVALEPEPVAARSDTLGLYFSRLAKGSEKILVVETDLYTAEISSKGARIRKWELQKFKTWDNHPVQLVEFDQGGDPSLIFTSSDGKLIDTRALYFEAQYEHWQKVILKGNEQYTVELSLRVSDTSRIVERLQFENGRYSIGTTVHFQNMEGIIANYEYQVVWETGTRLTEANSQDEATFAAAYANIGGELVELDAQSFEREERKNPSGSTAWVAARTKYFAVALVSEDRQADGAYLTGTRHHLPDNGVKESYSIGLKHPFKASPDEQATYTIYLGPLDFYIVKEYKVDLERIMGFGLEWVIRPISIYFMLPLFRFLHSFIPNYGLVIIVFTVLIRTLLYPLTHSSMKSMKKMQALQPLMMELKEKYKDDPQRMNKEVMKLYKDYGVNPASGCLLMLPQLPILYALWAVFRAAIELRQAGFVLWIRDLSTPDTIVHLPFSLPLVGTSQLSGLALFMGVTMFIQQKMTVKDPRQKMMIWFLPIMMTLLFNSLPSGLNLYYSLFNLLAIGQQLWTTRKGGDHVVLRKVDESKKKRSRGLFSRVEVPKLRK